MIVLIVLVGGAAYAIAKLTSGSGAQTALVRRYVNDWARGDYSAMYGLLSPSSTSGLTESQFASAVTAAATTATVTSLHFGARIKISDNLATVPVNIRTGTFGVLRQTTQLGLASDGKHLVYTPEIVFPGLQSGETLTRTSIMGKRGNLLASNGALLAEGDTPGGAYPSFVNMITGSMEQIPADQRSYYEKLGYPAGTEVGENGLEAIFEKELAGTPGGTLKAGSRVLATAAPKNGKTVKTTINPVVEENVNNALGASYSGMVVMNQKTGAVEAAVGLAFSALQPPGSTFKIITAAAALQYNVAKPTTDFGYATTANVGGYVMQNAGGEDCGGTLDEAFATSCDTTFGPLGITIGAKHLLQMAENFGFNQPTGIAGALESSMPTSLPTAGDNALGSAAIGQWLVQSTPLEIADVGATIANHGERPIPTFDASAPPRYVKAISPTVAAEVQVMMEGVVQDGDGTGTTAQIPGYTVAGKTGTAELGSTAGQQNDAKETDAWFVGYVPGKSDLVACALFPADGYGADSAAPAVKAVLEDALGLG